MASDLCQTWVAWQCGQRTELPVSTDRRNDSGSIDIPVLTGLPVVGHVIEIAPTLASTSRPVHQTTCPSARATAMSPIATRTEGGDAAIAHLAQDARGAPGSLASSSRDGIHPIDVLTK